MEIATHRTVQSAGAGQRMKAGAAGGTGEESSCCTGVLAGAAGQHYTSKHRAAEVGAHTESSRLGVPLEDLPSFQGNNSLSMI